MKRSEIFALMVKCVPGWGWNSSISENTFAEAIDCPLETLVFERAFAIVAGERIEFIVANMPHGSEYGAYILIRPLADQLPLIADGGFSVSFVAFGSLRLSESDSETLKRFALRQRQFKEPETRGFANPVKFQLHV